MSNEEFNWDNYKGGNRLIPNKRIKGQDKNTKCFSYEPYAQELFDLLTGKDSRIIKKDLDPGEYIQIVDVFPSNSGFIVVELDGGLNVEINLNHEKKFIQLYGFTKTLDFAESLKNPAYKKQFLEQTLYGYVLEATPEIRVSLWQGYTKMIKDEFMEEIKAPTKAFEAHVKECNKGGYFVEVQGVNAFMPGSLAAPNKIADFRTLLGHKVIVMIEDFIPEMNSFIVSHKKYIEHILPSKIQELDLKAQFGGTITGTSKYGIFIEFGDIFTGLLHISKMSEETTDKFKKRLYKSGDPIDFYINEVTKDNRIILTEESPTAKEEKLNNFIAENGNKVLDGKVAAVMNFGVIVNVGDISGLVLNREFRRRKIETKELVNGDPIVVKLHEFRDEKIVFSLAKHKAPPTEEMSTE